MKIFTILLAAISALVSNAPACRACAAAYDWELKAAILAGASTVEELSEEVMEKFSALKDRPVEINSAPRSKLLACGLMSDFQVEALVEYRLRTGDIMSFAELALVPGFTQVYVEALRPFVTLETRRAPGKADDKAVDQSITLRSAIRHEAGEGDSVDNASGVKYTIRYGERADLRWSTRTSYDDSALRLGTLSAALYGKRSLRKLVIGNFNARFGQGLAQWSGFSLSGYSTVASFRKNSTGVTPTGSFSPELNGVAADWDIGHFNISGAVSYADQSFLSMANLKWTGRRAAIGTTCVWSPSENTATFSTDWRIGLPGLSLYGEAAAKAFSGEDLPLAAIAGMVWSPEYGVKLAFAGRYYSPSYKNDWSGAALGFENSWLSATADAARNIFRQTSQYKAVIRIGREFVKDSLSVEPSVRLNARFRPEDGCPKRIDLRGDISAGYGQWRVNGRFNALWSKDFAWLWYAELGRAGDAGKNRFGLYSRFTLFCIDNWDDRIYVYERDAPGSFNVPSYYGRGFSLSLVGAVKLRRHAFHLRSAWTSYPWNILPKPGRFEVKLQYSLNIWRKGH